MMNGRMAILPAPIMATAVLIATRIVGSTIAIFVCLWSVPLHDLN